MTIFLISLGNEENTDFFFFERGICPFSPNCWTIVRCNCIDVRSKG